MVTGTPGSQSIPHTILCLLINTVDFGMPIREAVEAPRLSHAWFPDQITLESPESFPEAVKALNGLGHTVVRPGPLPQGDAHTIWSPAPNVVVGVADGRRNDRATAAGY
jgi:gamma-glutamyltranspeptidase/glutathione hydrolase